MAESAGDAFSGVTQGVVQIAFRRIERGNGAEDQRGDDGRPQREEQHRNIQADQRFGRNGVRRNDGHQRPQAGPCQQTSQHRAAEAEQQAFHEKLANQAPAARADGGTDGDLFLPHGGLRQQQVGHVSAGDEQQHSDRAHDDEQQHAKLAHHSIGQGLHDNGELLRVLVRIRFRQAVRDNVEIGLRLIHGDAGLQMPDRPVIIGKSSGGRGGGAGERGRNPEV